MKVSTISLEERRLQTGSAEVDDAKLLAQLGSVELSTNVGSQDSWQGPQARAASEFGSVKIVMQGELESPDQLGPRSDGGGGRAWLFMISACLIEALLWGFTTSYGIFFEHYKKQPKLSNGRLLATVGTFASGIPFLGAPLLTTACSRWPHLQRQMVWAGTVLCISSLIGASFATQDWHLLLSQGIGYGTGVLIVYYPMLAMVNSWFIQRRGFAYGVLFATAGVSGTALPFLVDVLLKNFGYRWTLRGYACTIVLLVIPTFPICHGKRIAATVQNRTKPQWHIMKHPILLVFSLANFFQGLAYYIPSIYLPSYASTLRLTSAKTVSLIAALNASQVIAQGLFGFISDKTSVFVLAPISTIGAAIWTFSLWYFGHTAGTTLAYSLLFGLFTGGFTSLWARFNMTLTDDRATQEFAYGLLATQRGLGNVIAGPISTVLLRFGARSNGPDTTGMYAGLTLFVAICMGLSSFCGLGALCTRQNHLMGWLQRTGDIILAFHQSRVNQAKSA